MADIKCDQYVQYEKWCRNKGKLTPLQTAQVARLKELDERCHNCRLFPDSQMMCEGTRLVFRPVDALEPHMFRLVMESCYKLDKKVSDSGYKERLDRAQLPVRVVDMIMESGTDRVNAEVERKGGRILFDGVPLEERVYEYYQEGLDSRIKAYMIAMANCGLQGIYLNTVDFYRSWVKNSRRITNIKEVQTPLLECDWLVVEAIDYCNEAAYFREALFTVVRTRASLLKPVTIIQTRNIPRWETQMEKDFFEESIKWPRLNLP